MNRLANWIVMWALGLVCATATVAETKPSAREQVESSGILNWMIEGAMQFLREGLGPIPAPVRKATLQYRHSEDEFGIFLKECTEKDPGGSVTEVGVLYEKYQEWCKSMEIVKVLTKIQFGKTMINRGYEKKRVHTGHVWCDLHLIRDGEIPEEDSP